jgi:CBS domain-containing protein
MLSRNLMASEPLVGAFMTALPITVDVGAPVEEAAAVMRSCRIRHLPVVDGAALIGVLSIRDVIAADNACRVGEIMTTTVDTAEAGWSIVAACERMLAQHRSCLPVLDRNRLVGIFTATDALRFALGLLERSAREPMAVERVARLMTGRPITVVQPATTLAEAWQLMTTAKVRHLPVRDGEPIVGMLSDRDVLAAGTAWLRAPTGETAILVADAMSPRVVTIEAERPAVDAARALLRRRFGALPVVRDGDLRGIITVSDFLYWILSCG